ncbi:hypothetical protein TWF481_004246 [Arthrobotrys musiformis]|uniref:Uncharacterized protein n=1 Tax=Arthrobotrys musiformis TaxID=47236 RepID=A0AAV9WIY3_9PEZI
MPSLSQGDPGAMLVNETYFFSGLVSPADTHNRSQDTSVPVTASIQPDSQEQDQSQQNDRAAAGATTGQVVQSVELALYLVSGLEHYDPIQQWLSQGVEETPWTPLRPSKKQTQIG